MVWKILAEHQFNHSKGNEIKIEERGLEHSIYSNKCITNHLVRNEDKFKKFLKDLIGVFVVTTMNSNDGHTIYYIPMEIKDLEVLINSIE